MLATSYYLLATPELRAQQNILQTLLASDTSAVVKKVLADPDRYRLQIIYTQIDHSGGKPLMKEYTFRVKPEEYYYPASLVKLPVAALSLEKLRSMKIEDLDRNTPLCTNPAYSGIHKDSACPSVAENIMRMMVVSDNFAFNRLYDFLGQEYIHLRLFQKGYTNTRIIQRMSSCTDLENRTTGPFTFKDSTGRILYEEDALCTPRIFSNPAYGTGVGKAYFSGRKKIYTPRDFSSNNFMPLQDAHQMLVSLMYPELTPDWKLFELSKSDYKFMKRCMSMYPREAGIEEWQNDSIYYDYFRKYILVGNNQEKADPSLRIFNKVGMAYGFMGDCAYIVDYTNHVEFFLSVVMYVNEDEVLNDNRYDYYTVGYPFMERVGRLVYEYERSSDICRDPDLVPPDYQ